jgi:thioesterase domain-containing protein/acyl carrier protein
MAYLEIPDGLTAFEAALGSAESQVIVVVPNQRERIDRFLGVASAHTPVRAASRPAPRSVEIPGPSPALRSVDDELIARLTTIASKILDLDAQRIEPHADLVSFGLDSIKVAEFISALNSTFEFLDFSQAEIFGRQTVAGIAAHLLGEHRPAFERAFGRATAALAPPAPEPRRLPPEIVVVQAPGPHSRPPSFWVPGSYGFSQSFAKLPEVLGPKYPIYGFHARGNDGKRMPFHRLDDMVAHYLDCLRAVAPARPLWLGGYSFGGLVALEMARQLDLSGEPIGGLILFDTYPPTQWIYDMTQRETDVEAMMVILGNFLAGGGEDGRLIVKADLADVPPRLRVAHLVKLIKERSTTSLPADELFNVLRGSSEVNDYASEVYRQYDPPPYSASPILYVRAGQGLDPYIDGYDYVKEWQDRITGALDIVELPFSHGQLMSEPALRALRPRLVKFLG